MRYPYFKLALRLLARDWRSGELSILAAALLIAVASSTAISLVGDRLRQTMIGQAAEFLAADLAIGSHDSPPDSWLVKAQELGLRHARTEEFSSVLMENDELLLTGVKAVSPDYPLRGYLRTTSGDITEEVKTLEGPETGTAWVDRRVLSALNLKLGAEVSVGERRLRLTRLITYEPDRRGDLYSLSPRVMINEADLAATGILQPGSHVHFYDLFAGDEEALKTFKRWLKPQLHPGQRIVDVHEDRPEIGNALTRAERYLGLASIVVVLIAGVAIGMTTRRYTERHFDVTAMFRCLGAQQSSILRIYAWQFCILGVLASLAGCLVGWFIQLGLLALLKDLLPQDLADASGFAAVFGIATGLLTLLGFALPPVLRLRRTSPLKVLRRDLEPLPSSAWLVYGLAMTCLALLMWRYTNDFKLTATLLLAGLTATLVLGSTTWLLLKSTRLLLPRVGLSWRFGLQHLSRQPQTSISQILAFSVTLVAMVVSLAVRTELLADWKRQLPADAPNHFALNIFPKDLDGFTRLLAQEGVASSAFYPIVRGRLIAVNGVDAHSVASKESQGEEAINRDLSLTWSDTLPPDNKLVRGNWWAGQENMRVSVEEGLARSLGIKLRDQLSFNISGQTLTATVQSIRSVQWDAMTPNFYMIFSPGSLDAHPSTYLTSFFLPAQQKTALNHLVKAFPSITILEVDVLLEQFQRILKQVTLAIEYVLLFALVAGFTVLFAAVRSSLDARIYEDVLLRTLGSSRRLLRRSQLIEFSTLGALAGLLAAAIAEFILWGLYTRVFTLAYRFHWEIWLMTPIIGALLVGSAGFWNTRSVVNRSPQSVLQNL
jgi:putative ABC transport system permease protein